MSDVLALLARANPVPEAKRPELEARAFALADSWRLRTAAATKTPPRSLWRLAVVAIVGLLVLVVAGTALAVRAHWLNFSLAEPGPPKNVKAFSDLDLGANEARRVPVVDNNGRTRTFWIAPTKRGGFCVVLDGGGGCERLGTLPLIVEWAAMNAEGRRPSDPRVRTQIYGAANARWINSVHVRFADGKTIRPRVTWVSRPIGFGFFYYDVPAEHRVRGLDPTKVVALDAAGNVVTESYVVTAKQPVPPVDAIQHEKTAVARAQTPEGEAILWRAPTRYRSTCAWVQLGDRAHMVDDCLAGGHSGPTFTFMPTRRSVVVAGRVARRFDRVELELADLSHLSAKLAHGFLLYSIPPDRLVAAKQLVAFRLVDEDGSTAIEDELTLGLSGCHAPLPTTETCR